MSSRLKVVRRLSDHLAAAVARMNSYRHTHKYIQARRV